MAAQGGHCAVLGHEEVLLTLRPAGRWAVTITAGVCHEYMRLWGGEGQRRVVHAVQSQ